LGQNSIQGDGERREVKGWELALSGNGFYEDGRECDAAYVESDAASLEKKTVGEGRAKTGKVSPHGWYKGAKGEGGDRPSSLAWDTEEASYVHPSHGEESGGWARYLG